MQYSADYKTNLYMSYIIRNLIRLNFKIIGRIVTVYQHLHHGVIMMIKIVMVKL